MNVSDSEALACTAALAADERKGEQISILTVGDLLQITEFFVIASASNRRLVRSIVETIEEKVKLHHDRSPLRIEGIAELQWVLMDYGDVVVHVFTDETHDYYEIERLYRDVVRVDWTAD